MSRNLIYERLIHVKCNLATFVYGDPYAIGNYKSQPISIRGGCARECYFWQWLKFLPCFGINLAWMLWLIEVEINYNLGLVLFLLPLSRQQHSVHQSWGRFSLLVCCSQTVQMQNPLHCIALRITSLPYCVALHCASHLKSGRQCTRRGGGSAGLLLLEARLRKAAASH